MATQPSLLSLDEYMETSYSPEREYVDGLVVERNAGNFKHSSTQLEIWAVLRGILGRSMVLTEQRVKVAPARVRIPDVCVVSEQTEVTTKPPLLCVEIMSPDDRWSRLTASISDYQEFGVRCVWVINPYEGRAWIFNLDEPPMEVTDGVLRAPGINVSVALSHVLPLAE